MLPIPGCDQKSCVDKKTSEGIVDIAPQTRDKFLLRLSSLIRLYEQGASDGCIGDYLKRFYQWAYSGLEQHLREPILWGPSMSRLVV